MAANRFLYRLRQFGGMRLFRGYARYGVAGLALRNGIKVLLHRKSAREASAAMTMAIVPKLRKRYGSEIRMWAAERDNNEWRNNKPVKKVWIYWMQGFEQAPIVVKRCVESVKRHLPEYEITLLSKEKLNQYVTFPEHIERKYKKGFIPEANYSDMIRLELLTKYGGTWLDATVMMTGSDFPRAMMESDLFVFQNRDNTGRFVGLSSWMITAVAGHPILEIVKDAMYAYWEDHNALMEYYLFHLFFMMAVEQHPEYMEDIERHSNRIPHMLQRRLADKYDGTWMDELKNHAWFHKLTYRIPKEALAEGTFYDILIEKNTEHE